MGVLNVTPADLLIWSLGIGLLLPGAASAQVMRSPAQLKGMDLNQLLETKVISMSRTLEDWQTAPTAISVLTAPEIERSGATRLEEVLRLVPGLSVSRYLGSSYSITARGFGTASVNKMQVLMDGRSLYTPLFSGVFWEVQDALLDDLDRIEIVRGPGATLWGANAMNGVINIVSKDARDTQGTYVMAGGGSEERAFSSLRYGGTLGSGAWYRGYVKYLDRAAQSFSDGSSAGDGMTQTQAGFRVDAGERTGDHFTLQGDTYWNTFASLGRPDARNRGWNLLGRLRRRMSENSEWTLQSYYDHTFREVPRQFQEKRDTIDVDLQWHVQPSARHKIVTGAGYRNSWDRTGTEADRTFRFDPASRRLHLVTAFVQDEITLEPRRWTLFVGSKFEHNDYSGYEVQPSVRLAWTPDAAQTAWAAVSRAVRTPTRIDTDSQFLPAPATGVVFLQGNPDFQSETARVYELGYRVRPHHAWLFDLATFYNDYNDLRSLEPTLPSGLPLVIANQRTARTYGAELIVTVQPTNWWRLRANVNYLHEKLALKRVSLDPTNGSLEADDPAWTGSVQSTLNLAGGFQFDVFVRGASVRPISRLAGYTATDLRLAWQSRSDWDVALVARNIFGSHAEFPASGRQPEVERDVYVRSSIHF